MFTRVRAMLPSAPRLLLMVAAIFGVTIDAAAATFVVNSPLDAVDAMPGNGVCATVGGMCTLRAAIQEANGLGGSHVITLPAGVYALTIAGRGEASAATGDLNITRDVTITGAGAAATIIDANGLDRAFAASSGGITLNDVTVRNGDPGAGTGGCINISAVNLTLARTVITSCRSDFGGGGIYGLGPSSVTVTDTTISQNSAAGPNGGGGIHLVNGITATMTRVTVAGNSAGFGGGIRVFGSAASPSTVTVTDSVIAHNATGAGGAGGVGVDGAITATLTRVTVTNNSGAAGAESASAAVQGLQPC